MIDPAILEAVGTTKARMREVFTSVQPANYNELSQEEKDKNDRDIKTRKYFEELIGDRLMNHINFSLKNHPLYSAVDLAWDSSPINKCVYPLMLYAQGKLDLGQCATSLEKAGFGQYISREEKGGKIKSIDVPRFFEVHVNLIRSFITRRLAAQANKYNNLWPFYKYESRSTSLVGKLRSDIMSQVADIMADNYDYRHHDVQCFRDTFMYGHCVDFIRCAWEKEEQWRMKPESEELETEKNEYEAVIAKEGLAFINPHPTRVFWDNAHPLASVNADNGCEYLGFWDVARYRDVHQNPTFFNRDRVSNTVSILTLFSNYSQYFSQYYCIIAPPPDAVSNDLAGANDRANSLGLFAGKEIETSVIVTNYYQKLTPKDHGLGDYPYPIWVRFVVAGDNTIMFAEPLPSKPAAVCSYNENDNRLVNISIAHELMGYQDQMTNLLSHLLLVMQADNVRILIVDSDVAEAKHIQAFKEQLKGSNAYTGTTVLEVSGSKMQELGLKPTDVISYKETKSTALDMIFRAIGQLVQMVERLMAMSPQEQGQPAPREISATETNLLAGTTESVYGFISDAFDEFRAAKKRIVYESYLALGNQNFKVPVTQRYSKKVIESAGFEATEGEFEGTNRALETDVMTYTVIGTKNKLEHDYIFTSRDGAERPANTQAANALVQLLAALQQPEVLRAMGKEKLFEVMNEIFRMSGTGFDLKLELKEGESDEFEIENEQLQPILQQLQEQGKGLQDLAEITKTAVNDINQIKVMLGVGQPQQQQPMASAA